MTAPLQMRRLRWLMAIVMLTDLGLTLAGQPSTYWQAPSTANEGNHLAHYFIVHGWAPFLSLGLLDVAGMVVLVSILPQRLALAVLLTNVLIHYFGGSSWITHHLQFGVKENVIYGAILATALV
jgi:hypothetical protein